MDKVDLVTDQDTQRTMDGLTLLRWLRDEASAILRHINTIDEHGTDLEWARLPDEASQLPEVLGRLKEIEQSLLRIEIAFEKVEPVRE